MKSFVEHISECITKWTSERSGRSLRALALMLEINETTLRRLRDKTNEPSFEAFEVLLPILDQDRALKYGEKKWPAKTQRIRHRLKQNFIACRALQEMMHRDQSHFLVIKLCASAKGLSLVYARRILGPEVEKIFDELTEKVLAYLNPDGHYHLYQKFFLSDNFESLLKQVDSTQKTVPLFDPKWISVSAETKFYSPAGFRKAKEAMQRFIDDLEKINRVPECQGDRMFMLGMIMGLLKAEGDEKKENSASGND